MAVGEFYELNSEQKKWCYPSQSCHACTWGDLAYTLHYNIIYVATDQ